MSRADRSPRTTPPNLRHEPPSAALSVTAAEILPAVYDELRRLAAAKLQQESAGHTLDATGLVHEAYLRLRSSPPFADRTEFFRAAAVAMQRVLIDHARRKQAVKRPPRGQRIDLCDAAQLADSRESVLLDLRDALERLAQEDAGAADVARLRMFVGLSVAEAAEALSISRATAYRDWAYAEAWLTTALSDVES